MNNNTTLMQEMLHCTDMTVLERQRARFKWQDQQQIQLVHQQQQLGLLDTCFGDFNGALQLHHHQQQQQLGFQGGLGELLTTTHLPSVKPDPNFVDSNMWNDVARFGPSCGGSGFEMNFAISRTSSCPPAAAAATAVQNRDSDVSDKISCGVGRDSLKKRKHDKVQTKPEVVAEEYSSIKKIKVCADEGEPKMIEKNNNRSCSSSNTKMKENTPETSKDDNSKVTEVQKPDYIHVRARRGQATDSHSLAERVRREKISERMKYLQDLVPGCDKITGKAGMLDEIINYVQSLQRQVEFLSMKLATVNPRLDFNIDNSFAKEAFSAFSPNFSTIGMSSEMTNPAAYIQFNPEQQQQQIVSCSGLDMAINPSDMGLKRTISAPIPVPETYFDSSCFSQIQPSPAWDADLQNLYSVALDQARSTSSFPSHQPFPGSVGAGDMKMEM